MTDRNIAESYSAEVRLPVWLTPMGGVSCHTVTRRRHNVVAASASGPIGAESPTPSGECVVIEGQRSTAELPTPPPSGPPWRLSNAGYRRHHSRRSLTRKPGTAIPGWPAWRATIRKAVSQCQHRPLTVREIRLLNAFESFNYLIDAALSTGPCMCNR